MWWTILDAISRSRAKGGSASRDPVRLPIALAQARERVMEAHIGQALELVQLSQGRMTTDRTIEMYCRLALLGPTPTEEVRVRVLAALANSRESERENTGMPAWVAWRRGRLDKLLRRRDDELRDWVDLHVARSRSVVIEAHVRSAIEFVDILAGQLNRPQAIAFYLQAANVPGHLEREVETFTMERLARRHLPLPITQPEDEESYAAEDEDPPESGDAEGGSAGGGSRRSLEVRGQG
jgi:hypothetical protein